MSDVVVAGIDPGSRNTGFGIIAEQSGQLLLLETGVVVLHKDTPVEERLATIVFELQARFKIHQVQTGALENIFVSKNILSALKLGQARGAALVAFGMLGISVTSYEPTLVKKNIVGVGRADKTQVAFMVGQMLGVRDNQWKVDASDALAVAICHLNMRRQERLLKA